MAAEEWEARVVALEGQVSELAGRVRHAEQDAAAARVLAGGADRDVTEIRGEIRDFRHATVSSMNAMRADLTDLRTDMNDLRTEMNERFAEVDRGFAEVDRGFTEMRGRLDGAAAGQAQIVELLTTLVERDGE